MDRSLANVYELWEEWASGRGSNPSVESLEKQWGPKWRRKQSEKTFFSRRMVIINHIRREVRNGHQLSKVLEDLDRLRAEKLGSLHKLYLHLNK